MGSRPAPGGNWYSSRSRSPLHYCPAASSRAQWSHFGLPPVPSRRLRASMLFPSVHRVLSWCRFSRTLFHADVFTVVMASLARNRNRYLMILRSQCCNLAPRGAGSCALDDIGSQRLTHLPALVSIGGTGAPISAPSARVSCRAPTPKAKRSSARRDQPKLGAGNNSPYAPRMG